MSSILRGASAALAALLAAAPAAAVTQVVTNRNDSGSGSLRNAVTIAAAGDSITFAPSAMGSIPLSSEIAIGRDLTILGLGAERTILSSTGSHRILNVLTGNVAISGVELRNGRNQGADGAIGEDGNPGRGGGILNAGVLTLTDVSLNQCQAYGGDGTPAHALGASGGAGEGGAIYNTGTLTVFNATFRFCEARGGAGVGSTGFPPGRGNGGLGRGGAILNAGTASLTNCTFDGNSALGGASAAGRGGDGRGGAVMNASSLSVFHCTLNGNGAQGGVGSTEDGDGEGGGLNGSGGVRSSIVAQNLVVRGVPVGPDAAGSFASQGFNLIGKVDGSSGWVASDQTGTIAAPLNPNLGLLTTANGGSLLTRAPLAGSAAIDRGGPGGAVTDQRGHPRPYDDPAVANAAGSDGTDIGAVEVQPPLTMVVTHLGDVTQGSLRYAVGMAAQNDSVGFAPGLTGTITLSYGSLLIFRPLTMRGPGAPVISIAGEGAGPLIQNSATTTLSGLTFTGAEAPAGVASAEATAGEASTLGVSPYGCIYLVRPMTISDCAIVGNATTGIVALDALTLRNSTIAGNSAGVGVGGLEARDDLTLENCTIAGNSGPTAGGVWLVGSFARSITNCTISDNHQTALVVGAGGLYDANNSQPSIGGTVVAENTTLAQVVNQSDVRGFFASQGYNLVGIGAGGLPGSQDQGGTVASPLDPMLGPLAMNGGPTPTMLPLAGSPVLDRGKSFGLTTDQRGYLRPYDDPGLPNAVGGDGSDVGAVESNPTTTAVETPTRAGALGIVGATPMPFRVQVTLAFTLGEAGEVDVSVYSVDGRRVRSLTRGQFEVGTHRVAWDGRDSSGRDAPAGVYFARLRGPQGTSARTIVRMR